MKPGRTAAYLRISTTKEEQEHGLATQLEACKEFVTARGLAVGDVLVYEEQASGRKSNRPTLKKLLHDGALHRYVNLVMFRLDRLSRGGITEMFRLLKTLEGYGVHIYSVNEAWWDPDAPTAELILAVLSWAARFESESIGARVSAGIAAKRAEAGRRGEPFLWGRARVSALTRNPDLPLEAVALREKGLSWTRLAGDLEVGRTTARRLYQIGRARQKAGTAKGEAKSKDGPRAK